MEKKILKDSLFNRIFRGNALRKQKEDEEMGRKWMKEMRETLLPKLEACQCIQDFINIHRELSTMGIKVDVVLEDQEHNYSPVSVQMATTEHYYCGSYDRDSTFHGSEMLYFEKSPSTMEYYYYSYCKAWNIYYRNLYEAITNKFCEVENVKYPEWFLNLTKKS